jgi:hypothetical protein
LVAARRSQLQEAAAVSKEAVSRIPVADQAACVGLTSQDRASLAANLPWIASGGSLPACATVPRAILRDISRPGLALATRKRLANTCLIALGDSTTTEAVIDLIGFLGARLPTATLPAAANSSVLVTQNSNGNRRNATFTFKDEGIVIVHRFTGHYNTGENHLGFQSLQRASLRTELEYRVNADCGNRERILWLESGPHDYSNSMHCNKGSCLCASLCISGSIRFNSGQIWCSVFSFRRLD